MEKKSAMSMKPNKIEQRLLDRMDFKQSMNFYEWLVRKIEEARN